MGFVLVKAENSDLEQSILYYLKYRAQTDNGEEIMPILSLMNLYPNLFPQIKNRQFGRYFLTSRLKGVDRIVWSPHPEDLDWFTFLSDDGYQGKKILLVQPSIANFKQYADIVIPFTGSEAFDKVYNSLK